MRKHTLFATSLLAVLALTNCPGATASIDPDQSAVHPPAGDGWQVLGPGMNAGAASPAPVRSVALASAAAVPEATSESVSSPLSSATPMIASTEVKTLVLPGGPAGDPAGTLTFSITPQDMNLRNALDRWLQTLGWQLAWKIDDDLPVEFNATFSGDFRSVLTQVMQATNHMRTPARVCKHTNNVIRVIARAANCKD